MILSYILYIYILQILTIEQFIDREVGSDTAIVAVGFRDRKGATQQMLPMMLPNIQIKSRCTRLLETSGSSTVHVAGVRVRSVCARCSQFLWALRKRQ